MSCPESSISFGTISPLPFADSCSMYHFLIMIILYFITSSLHCILSVVFVFIHFTSYPDTFVDGRRSNRRRRIVDNEVIDENDLDLNN